MKFLWMNILVFVITLSAMVIEKPFIEGNFAHLEALQTVPHFQTNALQNHDDKNTDKKVHIAEDFFAIVLIADEIDSSQTFSHYIPLYNLHRQKEYFLLI